MFFGTPNENDLYKLMFRYFNAGYLNFIILLKDSLIFRIVVTLSYYPALCIIYSRGKFLKNKIDASIKENKN